MARSERVVKSLSSPVWSGSFADLRRLLQTIQDQYEPFREDYVRGKVSHLQFSVDSRKDSLDNAKADRDKAIKSGIGEGFVASEERRVVTAEERLQDAEKDLSDASQRARDTSIITMTIKSKNERRTIEGSPSDLVIALEGRRFVSLDFEASLGVLDTVGTVSITTDATDGVDARVSSEKASWAEATTSYLHSQFRDCRPWWAFMRGGWFLSVLWLIALGYTLWQVLGLIYVSLPDDGIRASVSTVLLSLYGVATPILTAVAVTITRRAVPAFDLHAEGQKSRGSTVVRAIGAAGVAIALGVITNVISAAVAQIK